MMQLLITFSRVLYSFAFDYGTPPPELSAEEIEKALIKHDIYKDLGYVNYPKQMLQVNYDVHHLQLGTKIPGTVAIVPPDSVNYTHYDENVWYALLMVGLDLPGTKETPDKEAYQHWALGNIPEDQFLSAECLVNYDWKAAPYKKGLHRDVFLLYKQEGEESMVYDERHLMRSNIEVPRTYFNTTKFSLKYNLGDPVAVNFFIADVKEDHTDRALHWTGFDS